MADAINKDKFPYFRVPVYNRTDVCCYCGGHLREEIGELYYFCGLQAGIATVAYHYCDCVYCKIGFKTDEELDTVERKLSADMERPTRIERFSAEEKRGASSASRRTQPAYSPESINEVLVSILRGECGQAIRGLENLLEAQEIDDEGKKERYEWFVLLAELADLIKLEKSMKKAGWLNEEEKKELRTINEQKQRCDAVAREIELPSWVDGEIRKIPTVGSVPTAKAERGIKNGVEMVSERPAVGNRVRKAEKDSGIESPAERRLERKENRLQKWWNRFRQGIEDAKEKNFSQKKEVKDAEKKLKSDVSTLSTMCRTFAQKAEAWEENGRKRAETLIRNKEDAEVLFSKISEREDNLWHQDETVEIMGKRLNEFAWSRAVMSEAWENLQNAFPKPAEVNRLRSDLAQKKSSLEALCTQIGAAERDCKAEYRAFETRKEDRTKLALACTQLETKRIELQEEVSACDGQIEERLRKLDTLKDTAKEWVDGVATPSLEDLADCQKVRSLRAELAKLQPAEAITSLIARVEELQNEFDHLKKELSERFPDIYSKENSDIQKYAAQVQMLREDLLVIEKKAIERHERIKEFEKHLDEFEKETAKIESADLSRFWQYLPEGQEKCKLGVETSAVLQKIVLTNTEILNLQENPRFGPFKKLATVTELWEKDCDETIELSCADLELSSDGKIFSVSLSSHRLELANENNIFYGETFFLKDGVPERAIRLDSRISVVSVEPTDAIAFVIPNYFPKDIFDGAEVMFCLRFYRKELE